MNRSAGLRPGANLRSATNASGRRPALRSRFRGSKREIPVGRNLTPALLLVVVLVLGLFGGFEDEDDDENEEDAVMA
jgi:hypothetical protein